MEHGNTNHPLHVGPEEEEKKGQCMLARSGGLVTSTKGGVSLGAAWGRSVRCRLRLPRCHGHFAPP